LHDTRQKQPQLKNQLTKSHESSLPTIGRDNILIEQPSFNGWKFLSIILQMSKRFCCSDFFGGAKLKAMPFFALYEGPLLLLQARPGSHIFLLTIYAIKQPELAIICNILRYEFDHMLLSAMILQPACFTI